MKRTSFIVSKFMRTSLAPQVVVIFAMVLLVSSAEMVRAAQTRAGFANVNVPGDTALRGNSSGRLNVVVWYPASERTAVRPIAFGPPGAPYFAEGEGAKDAPIAETARSLPFVVVSHGTGGSAYDLEWLCVGLAARGYIVAAVNHPGNNALEAPTVAGNTVWWMRANDLSRVIDGILAMPRFGPRIDRARIGAAGVSLGGYTVLVVAGARADSRLLEPYCAHKPTTPVCSGESTPEIRDLRAKARALAAGDAAYRAAVAGNSELHRDPRVKAVFSIEPALGPAIIPASLAAIQIPIAFVAGLGDRIVPVMDNVIPDTLAVPRAQLTLFPKPAGHYTFLMDCTAAGRRKFPTICSDAGPERVALHRATLDLASSFFARTIGLAP
jgi:predicted dienelactone hydrolase